MKDYLQQLPATLRKTLRDISRISSALHLPVFLVGGIVRDCILRYPNLDVDIVVEGKARILAKALADKWDCRIVLHKQFQTATVFHKNLLIDISSARKETYDGPGALPTVLPGTLEEDLFRRDFTINALALNLNKRHMGQLRDPLGGLNDLIKGRIRVMHDQSFEDDPTRILRAVRFSKRYGFSLARRTQHCLQSAVKDHCERTVTPQRLFVELRKILNEADPVPALKMLGRIKFLDFLSPQGRYSYRLVKTVQDYYSNNPRLPVLFEDKDTRWRSLFLAFISLLSEDDRETLVRRFHFTKQEKESIIDIQHKKHLQRILAPKELKKSLIHQALKAYTVPTLIFFRCVMESPNQQRAIQWYLSEGRNCQLLLTGDDVRQMGVSQGRLVGEILRNVFNQKIDCNLTTKQAEWQVAKRLVESLESM
jgi:tRNA nucleotidyltransferase (CCA-adding enzyme)